MVTRKIRILRLRSYTAYVRMMTRTMDIKDQRKITSIWQAAQIFTRDYDRGDSGVKLVIEL